MSKLSIVISAFNEEQNIEECLKSVKFADEIVIVDNTSSDRTVEIAKKYTSKIFIVPNKSMLNTNKNFGFTKATCDWILSLDADERVTPELRDEIKQIINNSALQNGYWIPRKNIIFGKWIEHGLWWPDYQLRLFKKGHGKFPEVNVHEYVVVDGETEKLTHPLIHYNYKSVSQFLEKVNNIYSENEAEILVKSGRSLNWKDAISMPVNDFLKTFFFQEGYKDGLHGLVLSLLQAFYAEIVFAKAWEKRGFRNESLSLSQIDKKIHESAKDYHFWLTTSKIKETKNNIKKIYYRLIRKISW